MPAEPPQLVLQLTGGRTLTVTPADKGFPGVVYVQVDGGGFDTWVEKSWCPESSRSRSYFASKTNIPESEVDGASIKIIEWALQKRNWKAEAQTLDKNDKGLLYELTIRGIKETAEQGRTYPVSSAYDVYQLLSRDNFAPDTVIEWKEEHLDRLAVLDLDFHDSVPRGTEEDAQDSVPRGTKPTEAELDSFILELRPTPFSAWRTQGGGIHAVYADVTPFTAMEAASAAAAHLLSDDRVRYYQGTLEILNRTRHPSVLQKGGKCGSLHPNVPDTHMACLARFSSAGASLEQIEEALEHTGLRIGQKLPHEQCFIDPLHVSNSATPVVVYDTGIYCYSCAARGEGHQNGFLSWGKIRKKIGIEANGHLESAPLIDAARHFVHWNHVEYMMESLAEDIPKKYRKYVYSALMKSLQNKKIMGVDPRIEKAFHEFKYVRGLKSWLHHDTLLPVGRSLTLFDVAGLPSVQRLPKDDNDEESLLIPAKVSVHTNDGNLDGWKPLQAKMFVPIYAIYNEVESILGTVLCTPTRPSIAPHHVHYIAPKLRISLEDAEKHIQSIFPGISMLYVEALIIAMGCAESGRTRTPMLWATGASGSGKTTTIKIVQEMFGETFTNLTGTKEDRIEMAFGEALCRTRLVTFDDFAKVPSTFEWLHAFFLNIGSTQSFHRLYEGLTTVAVNSAVIMTDWRMRPFFVNGPQFGRRVHIIHLADSKVNWEKIKGSSVTGWWRRDDATRLAAESYFSHLVDKHFYEGCSDSFDIRMEKLNILRVVDEFEHNNSEESAVVRDMVRELVLEIGNSPDLVGEALKRAGKGAREVNWNGGRGIGKICTALVETLGEVKMDAENLHHVLEPYKLHIPEMYEMKCSNVSFHIKQNGKRTFIRLVEEGRVQQSRDKLINRELFTTWPPTEKMSALPPSTENTDEELVVLEDAHPIIKKMSDFLKAGPFVESNNGTLTVYLDFETYSASDLRKGNSYTYAQHESTRVICCALFVNSDMIFWTLEKFEGLEVPEGIIYEYGMQFFHDLLAVEEGVTLVAHNMEFERAIWIYTLKLPEPAFWRDTMDLMLSRGLPAKLDNAGMYLFNEGKDLDGHNLMMQMCKPNKRTGERPVFTPASMSRYIAYNFTDVYLQYRIAYQFGIDIYPEWEQWVSDLHKEVNFRGMALDVQFARTLQEFDEGFKFEAGRRVEELTRDPATGAPEVKLEDLARNEFMKEKLKSWGLPLPNMQAGTIEAQIDAYNEGDEEYKEKHFKSIEVLKNRLVATRAALSKVDKALQCVSPLTGRLQGQFRYHGAHTGRWAGYGIQPHNFKRPDESFDLPAAIRAIETRDLATFKKLCNDQPPYELLGSLVRGIIIPAPGHVFISADYNQIESRMLMWLSDDEEGLQEHRDSDAGRGPNVYCILGGVLSGHPITKKSHPDWYQAGKIGVLACGFQGGAGAIMRFAKTYGVDFNALGIDPQSIVDGWRQKYNKAVRLWKAYDNAFRLVLKYPEKEQYAGKCYFNNYGDRVEISLPSHRILTYMHAHTEESDKFEDATMICYDSVLNGQPVKHSTYGGKITENIDQAISRDLLADAMLRTEEAGFPIVLHVHDEEVAEVPESRADEAMTVIRQIMSTPPDWCQGIPLVGEPQIMRRYGK